MKITERERERKCSKINIILNKKYFFLKIKFALAEHEKKKKKKKKGGIARVVVLLWLLHCFIENEEFFNEKKKKKNKNMFPFILYFSFSLKRML
jgi:hypothetical protein